MTLAKEVLKDCDARRAYEEELLYGEATDTIQGLLVTSGISRQELARRLGVSPGRVSQILSGRENLTLRTLASLAWALGLKATLSIQPMADRQGTPAGDDPPAPEWLSTLVPTARWTYRQLQSPATRQGAVKKIHTLGRGVGTSTAA
jgi:transcriptional regulator with XRE-family HTH domain